jgi:hypothetical protein
MKASFYRFTNSSLFSISRGVTRSTPYFLVGQYARAYARYYSAPLEVGPETSTVGIYEPKTNISRILNSLYRNKSINYVSYKENQLAIEEFVFDQYVGLFVNYKGYSVGDINTSLLTGYLKKYIIDKNDELLVRIDALKAYYSDQQENTKKKKGKIDKVDLFVGSVIGVLDKAFILNLCLLIYLEDK